MPTPTQKQRSREETIHLNHLGRTWLKGIFTILRTSQIHDSQNQIFKEPIQNMLLQEKEILQSEGKAEFRIFNDQFFLNGLWIKPTIAERENLYALANTFTNSGFGGITIQSKTSDAQWRNLIDSYQQIKGPLDSRARDFNHQLAVRDIEAIVFHPILKIQDERSLDLPLPALSFGAVTSYAKALLAVREFSACGPGEEQVTSLRKAQRIVCDLIDLLDKAPRLFALLSLMKSIDKYEFHHGTNTCILSLLLAREIGFGRTDQVDLGMATLLHDVGKLKIPETILDKRETLDSREMAIIKRHPLESTKMYLSLGYLNHAVAERILVAFQHHITGDPKNSYPQTRRKIQPSLMAAITSICARYDALTSSKPYRGSLPPWEALRKMTMETKGGAFRCEVFNAFLSLMGSLPIGTWIQFEDGQIGFVAASGSMAPKSPAPLVFLPKSNQWLDKPGKIKALRANPTPESNVLGTLFQHIGETPLANAL